MKKALMKSRFMIGVCLLIQAFSAIVLFFSQWKKRKSLASACAAIAVVCGTTGTALMISGAKDEEEKNEMLEALRDDMFDLDNDEDVVFCTKDDFPFENGEEEQEESANTPADGETAE